MDREHIADLVHQLNDVELAVLLSLVARKHCILTTEPECLELLRQQIELVSLYLKSWCFSNVLAARASGVWTYGGDCSVHP